MYSRGFDAAMAPQESGPVKTGSEPIAFSMDATNKEASGSPASENVSITWGSSAIGGYSMIPVLNPPARSPNACKISGVSSGGAGLLGEDDASGRKRTAILSPQH